MLKWENRYSEEPAMETQLNRFDLVGLWCLTPLSTILQLYRGGLEETGVPGENQRPAASQWQTLSHTAMNGVRTHNFSGDRHWLHG